MMQEMQFQLESDYLVMASTLAEIKSRMLVPNETEEEDEEDPRANLIKRLMEYQKYKNLSEQLDEIPRLNRDTFAVSTIFANIQKRDTMPTINLEELEIAFQEVLKRAEIFASHDIQSEVLSVRERMSSILDIINKNGTIKFIDCFTYQEGRMGAIVTFLAILELAKESLIDIVQNQDIEGALLASDNPLSLQDIANLFDTDKPSKNDIQKTIDALNDNYKNHSFEIVHVASGFRMQVKKGYDNWVSKLNKQSSTRYSKAFLETLVIIAYKQPVTRGDIEEIRGVSVNPQIIRNLIEFEWVKVVGHKETPGKPELLATTKKFLDYFNLKSLSDLPPPAELEVL